MHVLELETGPDEVTWDQYVSDHPSASGYQLVGWRRVVEEAFGHRTVYLMARDEAGEMQGVLPLVFLSSRLFGRFLVSMPFFNYGGLLATTVPARKALIGAAVDLAAKLEAAHIELRHQSDCALDWPAKQHKVSMRLDIPGTFDLLWKGFSSKLRSQIGRARREDMGVRIGGRDILNDFYRVFSRNMRDLGTPVYARGFFDSMLRVFPKEVRLCVVYRQDRPLAAGVVFGFRRMLEIPWASSDRRFNRFAPNMLLYASVLEYACREGFQVFDFGRSTRDSGTYRFKAQWGARPVPLYWQYWVRGGAPLPDLQPSNPRYRWATQVWRRLPLVLANALGPSIVRCLP